jgi:hypothetical protein
VVYETANMAGAIETLFTLEMTEVQNEYPKRLRTQWTVYGPNQTDESDFTNKMDGGRLPYILRDLGIAFGVAIVIIYMLIVGWFKTLRHL